MSPRPTLILTLALLILIPASFAAAPTPQTHKHLKTPTIVNLDTDGYSTEGTALAGHFRGSVLERIVARHYGETGKCIEEYSFTKGHLTFLLSTTCNYNGNIADTPNLRVASTTATRYYFTADRLTRILESGKSVTRTAERRRDAAARLATARTFAKLLQKEESRLDQAQAAKSLLVRAGTNEFGGGLPIETIAVARAHGIDYTATVQHALARDRKAMHTLFALGIHTDAASSEGHSAVLGALLRTVGDDFFVSCLRIEPAATRRVVLSFLEYDFPNRAWHRQYPKTYALPKSK